LLQVVAGLVWPVVALAGFLRDTLGLPLEVPIPSLLAVAEARVLLQPQVEAPVKTRCLVMVQANQTSQQLVVGTELQVLELLVQLVLLAALVVPVAGVLLKIKLAGLLVAPASKAKAMQVGMLDTLVPDLVALAAAVRVLLGRTV
jgi:hypothetical protein